jgi:hypothetical protein
MPVSGYFFDIKNRLQQYRLSRLHLEKMTVLDSQRSGARVTYSREVSG